MGQKPASKGSTEAGLRIYVKRGATRRFDRLTRDAANLPVQVEWDRRAADRRSEDEPAGAESVGLTPRKNDRRKAPPFTWDLAEFVVVDDREEP